jgi:hypothetical protein
MPRMVLPQEASIRTARRPAANLVGVFMTVFSNRNIDVSEARSQPQRMTGQHPDKLRDCTGHQRAKCDLVRIRRRLLPGDAEITGKALSARLQAGLPPSRYPASSAPPAPRFPSCTASRALHRLRTSSCEGWNLRQIGDDVFRDPIAEELLLGIATHIRERQDCDRWLVGASGRLSGRSGTVRGLPSSCD